MTMLADDIFAIQNVKARYCVAVDELTRDAPNAADIFATIFLPDVVADYGFEPLVGADALIGFLCTAIVGSSEWRVHMIHTPLIDVDGDTATGDWTLLVHLKRPDGPVDVLLGRYSDVFQRTPDGWRISRVRFLRQG